MGSKETKSINILTCLLVVLLTVGGVLLPKENVYAWIPVNVENIEKTNSLFYRYVESKRVSGVPMNSNKITDNILPPSGQTLQDITLQIHPVMISSHICRLNITENLHVNISVIYYDNSVENRTLVWTVEEGTADDVKVRNEHNLSSKTIGNIPNIKNGYRIKEIKYSVSQGGFYFDYYRSGAGGDVNSPTVEGKLIVSATYTVAIDLTTAADFANLATKNDIVNLATKSDLTNIQDTINNIQSSIAPTITKVNGVNNSTATKTGTITIEISSSNATEYRARDKAGIWSEWTTSNTIPVPLLSKGVRTIEVQARSGGEGSAVANYTMTVFSL